MSSSIITPPRAAHWNAFFALFIGVTSLISEEFIPISLLTNIAQELHITEGQARQLVTAVGIFAVIASLLVALLTSKINTRSVFLFFSTALIILTYC